MTMGLVLKSLSLFLLRRKRGGFNLWSELMRQFDRDILQIADSRDALDAVLRWSSVIFERNADGWKLRMR